MIRYELTLDWLHERCAEIDGCLVWQRVASNGSDPQARIGGRRGGIVPVRRLVWEATNCHSFPRGHIARCNCETPLCVHPDHVVSIHKRDVQKGRKLPLTQRIAIAAGKRASSRLHQEDIERIRTSIGTLAVIAEAEGISPTYASRIRRHEARRDYRSPFLQLVA
jgi:hypothetical protein